MKQYHLASRACIIQKTMVVLLHFLTGTEGRIISPRTGSLAEDPKVGTNLPIQSTELYAERFAHTYAYTHTVHTRTVWLEWCSTPNRNVIAEEASRSRERPLRHRRVKAAQNMGPLWREIKLLCVVYATRQGTVQESVTPLPNRPFSLHFPSMPTYY